MFLKISRSSKENTCARVSILIKLQASVCNFLEKETLAQVLSCEYCEIFRRPIFKNICEQLLLLQLIDILKRYYRGAFRIMSNIYDGAFRENSEPLEAVSQNCFFKNVWPSPKYTSLFCKKFTWQILLNFKMDPIIGILLRIWKSPCEWLLLPIEKKNEKSGWLGKMDSLF